MKGTFMGPVEWYYARGDKQQGPVSATELKRLASIGQLKTDDLVWREGLTEWTSARNVQGLFEEPTKPPAADGAGTKAPAVTLPQVVAQSPSSGPLPAITPGTSGPSTRTPSTILDGRHLFDVLLDYLRQVVPSRLVEAAAQWMESVGKYGLLVGMGLCLVFGLIFSIKHNQIGALISALIAFFLLAVLQYGSGKFCDALERLNRSTNYVVCSSAYLDWSALSFLVLAIVVLLGLGAMAIQIGSLLLFLLGLGGSVVFLYLSLTALHPESIQISVSAETRAGEEAIGVCSFALKSMVRLTPVFFGTGVAVGCLMMTYAITAIFAGPETANENTTRAPAQSIEEMADMVQKLSGGGPLGVANATKAEYLAGHAKKILYISAIIPVMAYVFFLIYVLLIEVCQALLVLPGKLDKLSDEDHQRKKTPE